MGRDLHLANRRYQLDPSTPGPRTFEAAMAGTVQALLSLMVLRLQTISRSGMKSLYSMTLQAFASKSNPCLMTPCVPKRVALAARERVLKDHTYEQRARQLLACCGWPQSEIDV